MSEIPKIVRQAHGAGRWFPGDEATLTKMVDSFVADAEVPKVGGRIVAALSPHAGFVYSGKVAGYTFAALKDNLSADPPETVVVLGSSHRGGFSGAAIMDGDSIKTPVGETQLDVEAAELIARGRGRIALNYEPHDGEHSAENEIPFVQRTFPNAKLVVVLTGDHDGRTLKDLVDGLVELAGKKKILVVSSTDMLHDADYEMVSEGDRATLETVKAMDIDGLIKGWSPQRQTFCGLMPVVAAMQFAGTQGCESGTVLHYRNSGDDDPSSRGSWVVGYGAVVFVGE